MAIVAVFEGSGEGMCVITNLIIGRSARRGGMAAGGMQVGSAWLAASCRGGKAFQPSEARRGLGPRCEWGLGGGLVGLDRAPRAHSRGSGKSGSSAAVGGGSALAQHKVSLQPRCRRANAPGRSHQELKGLHVGRLLVCCFRPPVFYPL